MYSSVTSTACSVASDPAEMTVASSVALVPVAPVHEPKTTTGGTSVCSSSSGT